MIEWLIQSTTAEGEITSSAIIYALCFVVTMMAGFIVFLIKKIFSMQEEWAQDLRAAQKAVRNLHGGDDVR